jgi:hypothetical protein
LHGNLRLRRLYGSHDSLEDAQIGRTSYEGLIKKYRLFIENYTAESYFVKHNRIVSDADVL